jgi:hypothetical protein
MLPQGYSYSPTQCHNLLAKDLASWTHPDISVAHYIDDVLLTSRSLAELEATAVSLQSAYRDGVGGQHHQNAKTWLFCQILGCCMVG